MTTAGNSKTKGMRIKDVGATINLGNYSSLHVTIGEESEFAGLDIGRAQKYLRSIADSVGGTLNLPDKTETKPKKVEAIAEPAGQKIFGFGGSEWAYYDHATHKYTSKDGIEYCSVTQMLENFYPFNAKGVIKKEYMDFAASFGNMIHTAIQNSVIGMPPKKAIVDDIIKDVLNGMGSYDKAFVEQPVILSEQEIAGRFDILTQKDGKYTLWDVKTNSDIFAEANCTLPDSLKKQFDEYWNTDTIYGEHCLQLNIYAYIIEKTTDCKIDDIKIIYVPDKFKKILNVPKADISPIFQAFGAIR